MPDAPTTQLQTAIYETLVGDSSLMALISGVFNHVPQEQSFPYATIKMLKSEDVSNLSTQRYKATFSITIYDQARGDKALQTISQHVYDLLHEASLTLSGGEAVMAHFVESNLEHNRDGLTRSNTLHFRSIITAN